MSPAQLNIPQHLWHLFNAQDQKVLRRSAKPRRSVSKGHRPIPLNDRPNWSHGDRLDEIRLRMTSLEFTYQEEKIHALIEATQIGMDLATNASKWKRFFEDPYWADKKSRPTRSGRNQAIHFAIKRAFDLGRKAQQKASLYARAAKFLMACEIPFDKFESEIKRRGGIKKVAGEGAKKRRQEKAGKGTSEGAGASSLAPKGSPRKVVRTLKKASKKATKIASRKQSDEIVLSINAIFDEGVRLLGEQTNKPLTISATIETPGVPLGLRIHSVT